ncbi:unnamed protein product [Moneuplotes crassus]|uniref:Uncharacterized protein n=1 Tax=Euplotes crassus TaxID=5936 RepID=A0AAD1UEB3_EUPCR|nr:unnamed protein product [Moneuplotes crassus]
MASSINSTSQTASAESSETNTFSSISRARSPQRENNALGQSEVLTENIIQERARVLPIRGEVTEHEPTSLEEVVSERDSSQEESRLSRSSQRNMSIIESTELRTPARRIRDYERDYERSQEESENEESNQRNEEQKRENRRINRTNTSPTNRTSSSIFSGGTRSRRIFRQDDLAIDCN